MTDVQFVQANGLRQGYLEEGPEGAPVVVLLHGFPDHPPTFRHQMTALAWAGFRAIAPYLRGYAPTDLAPDGCYLSSAAAEDVGALIDILADGRAHVVGHDWGGVVGYGLAARFPEKVATLVTMAIPPPAALGAAIAGGRYDQLRRSWYMFFFQLQSLAESVVRAHDFALIDRLWEDWSPGYRRSAEEKAALDAMLSEPGVVEAALGWYRAAWARDGGTPARSAAQAAMAGVVPVDTLCIFGSDDGCISPELAQGMEGWFPAGLRLEVLPEAGHFVHLERPEEVNNLILVRLQRDH